MDPNPNPNPGPRLNPNPNPNPNHNPNQVELTDNSSACQCNHLSEFVSLKVLLALPLPPTRTVPPCAKFLTLTPNS